MLALDGRSTFDDLLLVQTDQRGKLRRSLETLFSEPFRTFPADTTPPIPTVCVHVDWQIPLQLYLDEEGK